MQWPLVALAIMNGAKEGVMWRSIKSNKCPHREEDGVDGWAKHTETQEMIFTYWSQLSYVMYLF